MYAAENPAEEIDGCSGVSVCGRAARDLRRWLLVRRLRQPTADAARCRPLPPVAAAWQWNLPAGFSAPLFPVDNPMRQAKVELGRALFHDSRISGNAVVRQLPCAGQCFYR